MVVPCNNDIPHHIVSHHNVQQTAMDIKTRLETVHAFPFGCCRSLPQLDFMISLSSHATTHGAKECICNTVNHVCGLIIALTFCAIRKNREKAGKYLQAIVASNHANVISVQTQLVLLTNDIRSG
jgi:hypothetical protein